MINKKHLKIIAFILILVISIGFAYLTSNLFINGLIGYRGNSWNIYFDNIQMINNDVDADKPIINNSKDAISFSLSFSEPGEIYKFSVDIINSGTLDAMLNEIIKNGIDSSNQDYISYTIKYYDDSDLRINDAIKAGAKTRIIIEVIYKYETSVVAPAGEQEFSFILKYIHANDEANYLSPMYESEANNVFTLNNVKSNSMSNFRIYGNTTQTQYSGQNLFDFTDVRNTLGNCTASEDGWITITADNTNGTSIAYPRYYMGFDNAEPGTNYLIVTEIKNVTGTGVLSIVSSHDELNEGYFTSRVAYYFSDLSNGTIKSAISKTKDSLEGMGAPIRCHATFNPGESGSVTFRISILKDTSITGDSFVYEPYVGGEPSPNPAYPQDVKNVTGDSTLKIVGKNIYNPSYRNSGWIVSNAGTVTEENGVFTFNATGSDLYIWVAENPSIVAPGSRDQVFEFNNKTYTATISNPLFTKNIVNYYDENMNPLGYKGFNSNSFTFDNSVFAGSKYFSLRFGYQDSVAGEVYTATIQLEEGDIATDYEPYKEHSYNINLGNLELNKIGGYKDYIYYNIEKNKWMLHKNTDKYTIDENTAVSVGAGTTTTLIVIRNQINYFAGRVDGVVEGYCEKLPYGLIWSTDEEGFYVSRNSKTLALRIRSNLVGTTNSSVSEYFSNNNTNIYYRLYSAIDLEIKDATLISQLDAIRNNNLFEGVNNIYYNSNISTDISFDYIEE